MKPKDALEQPAALGDGKVRSARNGAGDDPRGVPLGALRRQG